MCNVVYDAWYNLNTPYTMPTYEDYVAMEPFSGVLKDFRMLALVVWVFIGAMMLLDSALMKVYQAWQKRRRDRKSPFFYVFQAGGCSLERKPCPRKNYITEGAQADDWRAGNGEEYPTDGVWFMRRNVT